MKINGYSNSLQYNTTTTPNNNNNKSTLSTDKADKTSTTEKATANVEKVEKTKSNSLIPDWMSEKVKEMAKEDFKNGVYMDMGFRNMRMSYMRENISPDRASAIAKVTPFMNKVQPFDEYDFFLSMLGGKEYRATISVGASGGKYVHLYNETGEEIGGYSPSSGWVETSTKAEIAYYDGLSNMYAAAWDEAKKEQSTPQTATPQLDVVV